jgi:predicted metal-binding membrane protein
MALFFLWSAMSLGMMVPAALPMIASYLDIADAASEKRISVVPAGYLIAGYGFVWLLYALAATMVQLALKLTPLIALTNEQHRSLLLLIGGLYQFTPLKHACLTKCRAPMPYFLANWSDGKAQVFKMGVEQGALCLACCWALMLLMLAAGLMNLVWMGALFILIALEKVLPRPEPIVYGSGIGFFLVGLIGRIGST